MASVLCTCYFRREKSNFVNAVGRSAARILWSHLGPCGKDVLRPFSRHYPNGVCVFVDIFFAILLMRCAPPASCSHSLVYTPNTNPRPRLAFFANACGRGRGGALSLGAEHRAHFLPVYRFIHAVSHDS